MATFQSLKLLGDSSNRAVATWLVDKIAGAAVPIPPTIQGEFGYNNQPFVLSYKHVLDIQAVQQSYTFGVIRRIRVELTRLRSWFGGDGKYFIAGRVWIFIPATGELIVYATRNPLTFDTVASVQDSVETINDVIDVNLPPGTQIEVWFESDDSTGNNVSSPSPTMRVNLYN